jgi:hypothetical protein
MAPERNLIGNHGRNSRIYDRAASATRLTEKSSDEREKLCQRRADLDQR